MRRRTLRSLTVAAAVVALTATVAPAAQARTQPVAPPPTPEQLSVATNAMLGFDLARALDAPDGSDSRFSTGYTNPPGGQDPLPVCIYGPPYATVSIPGAGAVGYFARNGFVEQSVYDYPSGAVADRTWARLDKDIAANCSGSFTEQGSTVTVTRTRLAAAGGAGRGWAVTTSGFGYVSHVAVAPVGDAIQMVSYYRQVDSLNARIPAAIATLSGRLADRWTRRAALPDRQGPLLTGAALAALTPADVPSELPVTAPRDGGWSSYWANSPGDGPWTCAQTSDFPEGSWSSTTALGGTGDIIAEPGTLLQDVEVYQTDDAARTAWNKLRRAVLACNDPGGNPLTSKENSSRTLSGISSLTYAGQPGVWSRQFSVDRDIPLSGKSYSISLLSGSTIQTLTYYTTVGEITQIPLDQVAVNTLAVQLFDRWNTTQAEQNAS
jgi:hypothetical protein